MKPGEVHRRGTLESKTYLTAHCEQRLSYLTGFLRKAAIFGAEESLPYALR
jgi:hypothetical protein